MADPVVDDTIVRSIIHDKLNWATGKTRRKRIGDAFDLITYDRENSHQGDINYAAAEHYLFSRWLIAWLGPPARPLLWAAAGGYDLLKRLLPREAMQEARFGNGPVTPRAQGDLRWSFRGGDDGVEDFFHSGDDTRPPDPAI